MTGIGTVSFQDIPPYIVAAGNTAKPYGINITGLKRRGFSPEAIAALKKAYKALYKSGLRLEEAVAEIEGSVAEYPEVGVMTRFLRLEGRGIIR